MNAVNPFFVGSGSYEPDRTEVRRQLRARLCASSAHGAHRQIAGGRRRRRGRRSLRAGRHDGQPAAKGKGDQRESLAARARHAALRGRADERRARRDDAAVHRRGGGIPLRMADPHRNGRYTWERGDRTDRHRAYPEGAGRGPRCGRGGLSGRRRAGRHHDARARRLGHECSGARRGVEGRRAHHLYRCGRYFFI